MTIQTIGSTSVAVYFSPADLREHGMSSGDLTLDRALQLTRCAFRQAGITLDGSIEIDAFPDACGVLVFARIKPPRRVWYSFSAWETLMDGLRALPLPAPDGALAWWEDRWWISLPAVEDRAANLLSEFGCLEPDRPHLEAALAEHEALILPSGALTALLGYFPV